MHEFEDDQVQDQLTERELEILSLITEGLTNREIAEKLYLSLETIRWYSKRIYSKLHVSNRTQAAGLAKEKGLISDDPIPDSSPKLPKHNLPAQVTAFVGREKELGDLSTILNEQENRLITILAPGGMGKTRLAIQVAKAEIVNFPDGVFFISLENLDSRDQIIAAIFETLKIQPSISSDLEQQLLNYLKDKNLLLILDGFEKLISESILVSKLLSHTYRLKVLVTSRERLKLQGENIYGLRGLEIPQLVNVEQGIKSSSVKLFLQSAKLVKPNFNLQEIDLPLLVRICRLVDGMPLGILLAAAWIEVLSPEDIANEIVRNLDFLKTEKQDVPERQRSIQVVFDYSMGLLQVSEQSLFIKLSVFQSSFTREAALEVAGAEVTHLARFIQKSLLLYDPLKKRYKLHELLRQYAIQRLDQNQLLHKTYNAHQEYYAGLLMKLENDIKGPDQLNAFDQIQVELENIRLAWNWAINKNDFRFIDKALESLYWFCILRNRVPDGEELFQKARKHFAQAPEIDVDSCRRRILLRFYASGDEYKAQLERALSLSRRDANKSEIAFLLWAYGVNGYVMQEFKRAIEAFEESLLLFDELNDHYYSVEVLHLLWICNRFLGNIKISNIYYQQALEVSRTTGNKIAIARALGSAGAFQLLSGDYAKAEISSQEALELRRETNDYAGEAMSLAMLGWLLSIRGNLVQAKTLAESGLKIATDVYNLNSMMTAMNILGWIACLENDFEYALELCKESYTQAPDPTVKVGAELVLSFAFLGIEDYQASKKHLRNVLDFCLAIDGYGLMFLSLPIIALNLAIQGERERATEIVQILISFPKSCNGWILNSNLFSKLQENLHLKTGKKDPKYKNSCGKFEGLEEIVKTVLDFIH